MRENQIAESSGFTVGARLRSFLYAGRGVRTMLRSQHNAWIHAAATVFVIALEKLYVISPW